MSRAQTISMDQLARWGAEREAERREAAEAEMLRYPLRDRIKARAFVRGVMARYGTPIDEGETRP